MMNISIWVIRSKSLAYIKVILFQGREGLHLQSLKYNDATLSELLLALAG